MATTRAASWPPICLSGMPASEGRGVPCSRLMSEALHALVRHDWRHPREALWSRCAVTIAASGGVESA